MAAGGRLELGPLVLFVPSVLIDEARASDGTEGHGPLVASVTVS
jgi:hypothetical protein